MPDQLAGLDATAQAALVRNGTLSPGELAVAAVERIEDLNPTLNAVIHPLFEQGLELAAQGPADGPFRGVPFLLKDLGATFAGQPFQLGTKLLRDMDFRAPVDTYLARRFADAGLVTLGKTNCPELGILPTTEPVSHGATLNPWDVGRSPGGSSGGSAAAVASGMVPVAHASDGGGSIRIPAGACGLVGLKPTRQRITEGPILGDVMSGLNAEFVLARSIRDVATMLDAVHGPAPGDPYVAPAPRRSYAEELDADPGRLRIGLATSSLTDVEASAEVSAATRNVGRLLESLGHTVDESGPGGLDGFDLVETFLVRWKAGQAATLLRLAAVAGRELDARDFEPCTWALAEAGKEHSAADYLDAVSAHQAMTRLVAGWYESGYDLLLTPTLGERPPMLGEFDDGGPDPLAPIDRARQTVAFTALLNATGQPAISLPLEWSEDGLPLGVQLVAPYGREDLLIAVAAQLERARPWTGRTPSVFAGSEASAAPAGRRGIDHTEGG